MAMDSGLHRRSVHREYLPRTVGMRSLAETILNGDQAMDRGMTIVAVHRIITGLGTSPSEKRSQWRR